ncbi:MAG: ATP-binding cassette domain-containing protein [Vagococcus salmoninarum]|uniref:ABC transporter ATP-binding protein/permease n=1 Tax=Vagococcus salmoninarum TaxID=2739 RepID=UPI003F9C3D93
MIQLNKIKKVVADKVILDDISTTIGEGLSFITGPSGSGKSSLLRILAGIDQDYQGEVLLDGQLLNALSNQERSALLNNKVGFIWQDYKLLNELTVLENLNLPTCLKKGQGPKAEKIMLELKISQLAEEKVKDLSGGQRQRVAIARELMKDPDYLLADEPTSALDQGTAREVMGIFRELAKSRNIIVVTHELTNISQTDQVIELDKGVLLRGDQKADSQLVTKKSLNKNKGRSMQGILKILKITISRHQGRFLTTVLTLLVGSALLLGASGEKIQESNQNAFADMIEVYGENILDISLVPHFMSAAGTGNDSETGPSANVNQDVSALYQQYQSDERIQFVTYSLAFNDIEIKLADQDYQITSSGNAPVINKLLAGEMPKGLKKQVVVPESFIKKSGLTMADALGQELEFSATITTWQGETPIFVPTKVTAEIVGVINTTVTTGTGQETFTYEIEDSFFFSESALTELLSVSEKKLKDSNFIMRTNSPASLIAIKDELNSQGIVPLGNFEIVEDVVRLGQQSTEQTSSVNQLMIVLVLATVGAIYLISTLFRSKEYAIFKVNGFNNLNLVKLNSGEVFLAVFVALTILLALSPFLNQLSEKFFGNEMLSLAELGKPVLVTLLLGALGLLISSLIIWKIDIMKVFKVGKK